METCRKCKHWQASSFTLQHIGGYSPDIKPKDGWLTAVCRTLQDGVEITASGGWEGATVDSVETDANFGCIYFEEKPTNKENNHG